MIAGAPVDGPALSRWWERVSPLRPKTMWVGMLDLVHFEAPVRILRPRPLDPLHRLLLRALATTGPTDLNRLDARLGIGPSALHRWLAELSAAQLVRFDGQYALTPAGRSALESGTVSWPDSDRRQFTFILGKNGSPHFLPWLEVAGPNVPELTAAADARWLAECIARPAAWKRRIGFPDGVTNLDGPDNVLGAIAWRRMTVVRGERPLVAIVLTADVPNHLVAFTAARGDLDLNRPALQLDAGWEEPFPELATDPTGPRTPVGESWTLIGGDRLRRAGQSL